MKSWVGGGGGGGELCMYVILYKREVIDFLFYVYFVGVVVLMSSMYSTDIGVLYHIYPC